MSSFFVAYGVSLPCALIDRLRLCFYVHKLPWDCAQPVCTSDQYDRAGLRAEQQPGKCTEALMPHLGFFPPEMCPINDHTS